MELVAFNHGTHPVRDYAEHADLLAPSRDRSARFVELDVPSWVHDFPADRFFHWSTTTRRRWPPRSPHWPSERNVGSVYRTEGTGANPWSILPADFPAAYPSTT